MSKRSEGTDQFKIDKSLAAEQDQQDFFSRNIKEQFRGYYISKNSSHKENYSEWNLTLTDEQQEQSDFNGDGRIDVLDVVQIVNFILSGGIQNMPKFLSEDINPNSEFYGQYIGPDTFSGDISVYYFGKAG